MHVEKIMGLFEVAMYQPQLNQWCSMCLPYFSNYLIQSFASPPQRNFGKLI